MDVRPYASTLDLVLASLGLLCPFIQTIIESRASAFYGSSRISVRQSISCWRLAALSSSEVAA